MSDAIGYANHYSRSHHAVIRVDDDAGNVIQTDEHAGNRRMSCAAINRALNGSRHEPKTKAIIVVAERWHMLSSPGFSPLDRLTSRHLEIVSAQKEGLVESR